MTGPEARSILPVEVLVEQQVIPLHVYTRNKAALHQSVMQTGERKSVWELVQLIRKAASQSRPRMMPCLCVARQCEIDRGTEMER